MRAEFVRRRTVIVEGLNALPGVTCRVPAGAFYAFPNVSELPLSADELAAQLLEGAGVATLSGTAFGANGDGYLRVSYANSEANLLEALRRMNALIETMDGT
jgi:aspartate/methionine/tyrosine aminotransferase